MQTATKKQKPHSKKKEAATSPKSKEVQPVPELVHTQPTAVVHGQTNPAEGLCAVTPNKEPVSPVPLVMLLPVPSTSASDNIQNPLNSDLSKTCLSAPQVIQVPLPPTNCSIGKESEETVLVKDVVASSVSGSKILIPLTSVKNDKTGWALLEGPCTSGSVTKIYALKKEQAPNIKLKPVIYIPQLNAKNQQKNKVLSNEAILQVIHIMKNNVCGDKRMGTLSSLTTATPDKAEMKAGDEKEGGSRLENGNASSEKSSEAQLTTNMERESAVKMQSHCPDLNSSVVILDSSVKRQPEEVQIPKSKFSLSPAELSSKNKEQKTDQPPEKKDMGLDSAVIGLGDESDIVQCETCGKIILEKDLVQHNMMHSASSGLTIS